MHGCDEGRCPCLATSQALVFSPRPLHQRQIDVVIQRIQLRGPVAAIVLHPSPKHGIEQCRYGRQLGLRAPAKFERLNPLPHLLQGRLADRWVEADKQSFAFVCLHSSRPECVPQEVERRVGVLSLAPPIHAVDDSGLVRMHFEAAFCQPLLKPEL